MKEIIVAPAMRKGNEVRIARFCYAELRDTTQFCKEAEKGFVTNYNRFVDRKEALEIAMLNNRNLNKLCPSDELYLEELLFLQEHDLFYIKNYLEEVIRCMAKELSQGDEMFLNKNIQDIIDYFEREAGIGKNYPLLKYRGVKA